MYIFSEGKIDFSKVGNVARIAHKHKEADGTESVSTISRLKEGIWKSYFLRKNLKVFAETYRTNFFTEKSS